MVASLQPLKVGVAGFDVVQVPTSPKTSLLVPSPIV
jgi:hypothetical protein